MDVREEELIETDHNWVGPMVIGPGGQVVAMTISNRAI
jgi:hypothetical protein